MSCFLKMVKMRRRARMTFPAMSRVTKVGFAAPPGATPPLAAMAFFLAAAALSAAVISEPSSLCSCP